MFGTATLLDDSAKKLKHSRTEAEKCFWVHS